MHLATRIGKLIALPIALSIVITELSKQQYAGAYAGVAYFVGVSLLIGIITPLTRYVGMLGENKIYDESTTTYFSRLVEADLDYFHSNLAGYLTTATRQYVDSCVQLVRALRDRYMTTLLGVFFPLVVIMWLDVWLGLVALGLSVIQAAYLIWASNAITPFRSSARELYKKNSGRMADVISNILAVRSNAQEAAYIKRVSEGAVDEANAFKQRYTMQARLAAMREFITVGFFMVLLWLTVARMSSGAITITTAIIVVTYTTTILSALYSLSEDLDAHDDFVDKIIPAFEILNRQNRVNNPKHPKKLGRVKGEIEMRSVSFAYDVGQNVLDNFTLRIPAGQKVGIVD
jgi:ATP-binding cassette subfamily B protein